MRQQQRGLTLIELVIVTVIVGILAAIAVPSYHRYVMRSQRTDAKEALLRLATAQEKFYLQNNRYADNDERDDAPPAGLGIDGSEHGWYTLSVDAADAIGFTISATAVSSGPQAEDSACQTFTTNNLGLRTSTDSGGTDSTATCWN